MWDKIKVFKDRIRHSLHKRSIQFSISISFTIVMVIGMALIAVSLSVRYVNSTMEVISNSNKRIVDQISLNLDSYLRSMMRISDSMYYRVIKNSDLKDDNINYQMSLLYETNRDQLVSIAVFSDDGKIIASEPLSQLKPSVDVKKQSWFQIAMARIENLHFSTPHVEDLFLDPDDNSHWVISLSRSVELTSAGSILHGVLLVDMNYSGIEQVCKNNYLGGSGYVYITDENGQIIYHPKQRLIYSNLTNENNLENATHEDGTYSETFDGRQRLVTVKTVGYTGWKIIAVNPIQDITANYSNFTSYTLLFALFISYLLIIVNMFLSSRIAKPIMKLENSVKNLESGDLDEQKIAISGSYEVEHLGKAIRSMVRQTRKLMDDIVSEQKAKRRSELDALQAQINPHFLYNTLDSIVWMNENGKYQDANTMVTSLAKLFRISISKGKDMISVADELEHVKNYLIIQNHRFADKFQYSIHAEPQILQCATIKLIIQPLVENSIYHGMEFMDDGEIRIEAYCKDHELWIDVIDNGPGMPQEQADRLLSENTAPVQGSGSGIGLKNINERIQLYFGMQYGLSLFSEPDVGTTARIHLPKKSLEEFEEKE
ncbi:Cache domain protein [Caprobacter fermentans]|uniref:histidine kinase n=1 Tax=Caproicibacter fermentans TaxID=2576756 RepID=A0A6N8I039_9FIRM|nr:histidine kinase [Caproicibacter fermentans]MVB11504.1 Cache domain protein [Caproicibacter fermentans]